MSKPSLIFTGDGKEIAGALGHISGSIAKGSTLPVLSCVALQVRDGKLVATGTDLDQQHSIELPAIVERAEEGAGACAAAGLLSGLLARCNGDGARVVLDGENLTVSAGGRKAAMKTLPLAEFPAPHKPFDEFVEIEGAALGAGIRGVAFAVSNEEMRYVLNGIHLSEDGMAVATDGRRLARFQYAEESPAPLAGAIVPTKALATIADLLERHERVQVAGDSSGVCFVTPAESFFTKLIEGNYPNFRQVIPNFIKPTKLTVERPAMQKALAWAKLYRTSKDTSVKLAADGGQLTVSVSSPEVGEAEEVLPLIRSDEAKMRVALNLTYLEQMVNREGGDYFQFECEPETGHNAGMVMGPILVREENEAFLGVLMPMRLNG